MHITFSPIRHDATLALERYGDTLVINGTAFDFAPVEEGAYLPADAVDSEWITGAVTRRDGELRVTVLLPLSARAGLAARHPQAVSLTRDGTLALPTDSEAA